MTDTIPPPPFRPPAAPRIENTEAPDTSGVLAFQIGIAAVVGLYFASEVLIPITLAVLLSFLLAPLVTGLRRVLPHAPAVLLAVALALGAVLGLGGLIGTQVAGLARDVPRYAATIQRKVETVQGFAEDRVLEVLRGARRQMERLHAGQAPTAPGDPAAEAPTDTDRAPVPVEIRDPTPSPLQVAERLIGPVLGPLATAAIVFVFTVFMLLQREDLRDRFIRLFGAADLHRTTAAMDEAGARLSRFFLAQFGVNAAFGCTVAAGLFLIGVPSPVLWGVLGAMFRYVPYLGTPLAAAAPLALAAAVDPGWSTVAWTAGLFAVVEGVTGNVLEPLLYGRSTGLSPFAVVAAATFWTWMWGPVGLFLSTPLTLCLVVMGRHVRRLGFLDVLLGDRPALTPAENFYQRMLAGDPDEVQDHAEALLQGCSLSAYYDDVVVEALRCAAGDLAHRALDAERFERVKQAVEGLVADLDRHDDRDPSADPAAARSPAPPAAEPGSRTAAAPVAEDGPPPAWRAEGAVLCVAGRGPLDGVVAAMLAQVLRKHGLGARAVPNAAASRGDLGGLDPAVVAMACVVLLDVGANPARLRHAVRRLRARLPGRPVLVGLWPAGDTAPDGERVRAEIGADRCAGSLRDAVRACLDQARRGAGAGATPAARGPG